VVLCDLLTFVERAENRGTQETAGCEKTARPQGVSGAQICVMNDRARSVSLESFRIVQMRLARKSRPTLLFVFCAAVFAALCTGSISKTRAQTEPTLSLSSRLALGPAKGTIAPASSQAESHGLSQKAQDITHIFGFPITNSMIVSWIVAACLIILAQFATRRMKQVPDGIQNVLEWLVEGLFNFLADILGRRLTERTFWFFATIFIFIVSMNWAALIPGVGSIGWGHETAHGFKIDEPLFRSANADVNTTLAMALVFFVCWIVWALREVGPRGILKELFGAKGESSGALKVLMGVVFFAAGFLECVSILFRPVSLGFRLYGNVFAGESMLETMAHLSPQLGWLVQIPFYFLELLMGLVQALVFMLLTAVFTLLICRHEEEPVPAHAV
jgi:F-type H+-transporting ATPase subunit a